MVEGLRSMIQDLGFGLMIQGVGCRVKGAGFGFRVPAYFRHHLRRLPAPEDPICAR